MEAEKNIQSYFQKILEIRNQHKESDLSQEELKKIAAELGINEKEWHDLQKGYQAYLHKGEGYLRYNNWKDAIEEFEQALTLNPHDADVLFGMASAYHQKWQRSKSSIDSKKAIDYAEKCLNDNPGHDGAVKMITEIKKMQPKFRLAFIKRMVYLGLLLLLLAVGWVYRSTIIAEVSRFAKTVKFNTTKSGTTFVLNDLHFESGSSNLQEKSKAELDSVVVFMKKNIKVKAEVAGHTDNIGDPAFNLNLSLQRAKSVYEYLIRAGIDQKRLRYNGYGDSRPALPNDSETNRAKNRRIEFKIL